MEQNVILYGVMIPLILIIYNVTIKPFLLYIGEGI